MAERLLSVGLDVGTTTTQLIVSRLQVENRASSFAVPDMHIAGRQILYQSPVHFTPLLGKDRVDGKAIGELVKREYAAAGIRPEQVDTGAVIITGETSRKENAGAVLQALSGMAGDFVVATAGPHLESLLAAKGAGAAEYSRRTGKRVLHMDIGGGTSNLALIEEGEVVKTGCLNVGGRLLKLDDTGRITYLSPVLEGLTDLQVGSRPTRQQLEEVAVTLTHALEMAAGLRETAPLLETLWTKECAQGQPLSQKSLIFDSSPCTGEPLGAEAGGRCVLSFSGGVADCIGRDFDDLSFGDIGPILGRAIRKSRLCAGAYMLGAETIRATVIGAGCHSAQLSGSTVFCRGIALPVKNLPVAVLSEAEQKDPHRIAEKIGAMDAERVVLAMPGYAAASYEQVGRLARAIREGCRGRDICVCLEHDMAKALGHRLCLELPQDAPCLCIDRLKLTQGSFLDVGAPVGPCLPVVIKTLILSR